MDNHRCGLDGDVARPWHRQATAGSGLRHRLRCGSTPIPDLIVVDASQEHGIIAHRSADPAQMPDLPIGTQVRVLPNHACATAAQFDAYQVLDDANSIETTWPRFSGW